MMAMHELRRVRAGLSLLAVCCVVACSSDTEEGLGPTATFLRVEATLPSAPAEPSEALVLWDVHSVARDYLYVWGRSSVRDDGSFEIDLQGRPPPPAMNYLGLALGYILIAPRSADVRDGLLPEDRAAALARFSGSAERHAIVFVDYDQAAIGLRAKVERTPPPMPGRLRELWILYVLPGYSCGEGQAAAANEPFDSYTQVECADLDVRLGNLEDFHFYRW